MNIKLIEMALNGYGKLPEEDTIRLSFFKSIWNVQSDACQRHGAGSYEVPSEHDLGIAKSGNKPVLYLNPMQIDAKELAADCAEIAECITVKKMFNEDSQALLSSMDWESAVNAPGIELAGKDPVAYLDLAGEAMVKSGALKSAAHSCLLVMSLALRCQLDGAAQAIVKALKKNKMWEEMHPLTCPVCGGEPTLSHVGAEGSGHGRNRALFCLQCGTAWEFERIRCARCGTQNQSNLHYFNVEGDDSHRINTCDECGGYMRTVFSEEGNLRPISYEVEDVMMARLDAIAHDPKFQAE